MIIFRHCIVLTLSSTRVVSCYCFAFVCDYIIKRKLHGGLKVYEFYLHVGKTIFDTFAAFIRKTLFSPLEDKINIFAPPCNILYISPSVSFSTFFIHKVCKSMIDCITLGSLTDPNTSTQQSYVLNRAKKSSIR